MDKYELLENLNITPSICFNHGPSTSFYYRDPDDNVVEMSGVNFATHEAYLGYFKSPAFKVKPEGIRVEADDIYKRFRAGESIADLTHIAV